MIEKKPPEVDDNCKSDLAGEFERMLEAGVALENDAAKEFLNKILSSK